MKLFALLAAAFGLAFSASAFPQEAKEPLKITLTTIDVPGAMVTGVSGINNLGMMVGPYGTYTSGPLSGFLYYQGAFTYFDYPGETITEPGGINDSGLIAGYATQNAYERYSVVGFLYDGTTFTTLRDGGNAVTNVYGLNSAGTVVGSVGPNVNTWGGFEEKNGHYKPITFPGYPQQCSYAYAEGINNLGQVVGTTYCGIYIYGYVLAGGKFVSVQYPGTTETAALGINDLGTVVGWYGAGQYFYAFASLHGKYVSFSYPGAVETFAYGINNSGQIVGGYTFDYQTYHGFVSSPITEGEFGFDGCCPVAIAEGR
jgi:probable HAF family extracellular repeat protein